MAKNDFFDTVKPHTLLKLKVLEKYLDAYSEIMGSDHCPIGLEI